MADNLIEAYFSFLGSFVPRRLPHRDKVSMDELENAIGMRPDVREQWERNKAANWTGPLWDGPGSPFRRGK